MRVGGREIVYSTSLILAEDEDATFDFTVEGWGVQIRVLFEYDDNENRIKLSSKDNVLEMRFMNWGSKIGTTVRTPQIIGKSPTGRDLSFIAVHWKIGAVNKLDLQFSMSI